MSKAMKYNALNNYVVEFWNHEKLCWFSGLEFFDYEDAMKEMIRTYKLGYRVRIVRIYNKAGGDPIYPRGI